MIMARIMMLMTTIEMMMMMMTSLSMMLIGACDPNCVLLTSHTWQPKSRSLEILNAEEKTENIQSLTDLCLPHLNLTNMWLNTLKCSQILSETF